MKKLLANLSKEKNKKDPLRLIILLAGVLLCLNSYFCGRALWIDELMISLNIIHFPLSQLQLKPLLYYQVAPVGFITIQKSIITLFDDSEWALRLFPFLCSLASFGGFLALTEKSKLSRIASLIALAGFCFSRSLVYYAGEAKPYSCDVLLSLCLLFLANSVLENPSRKNILTLGLFGTLIVWAAYPAYFVLLGIGITLIAFLWRQGCKQSALGITLCLLCWTASMGTYYLMSIESIQASKAHQAIWSHVWQHQLNAFMPSLFSLDCYSWLLKRTIDVFKYPVGSQIQIVAALIFFCGLWSLFLKQSEGKRPFFYFLLAPIITTLIASAFHWYPFIDRMVLFLVPNYLLLMAFGLDTLSERFKAPQWLIPTVGTILIIPSLFSVRLYDLRREEIKPVLSYIQNHQKAGDRVLVYYGAQPAIAYYKERYHLPLLIGAEYQGYLDGMERRTAPHLTKAYIQNIGNQSSQTQKRLWLLISHNHGIEEQEYVSLLSEKHPLLSKFTAKGSTAYLFKL